MGGSTVSAIENRGVRCPPRKFFGGMIIGGAIWRFLCFKPLVYCFYWTDTLYINLT